MPEVNEGFVARACQGFAIRGDATVAPEEIEPWLSSESSREWIPAGVPEGTLRSYRVGAAVGKPGLETPDCIKPLLGAMEQTEMF